MKIPMFAAAISLFLPIVVAEATTYKSLRDVGGNMVNLSITTDGLSGLISPADITSFRIEISGPLGRYILTPTNADPNMEQGRLTATSTSLLYDFSSPVGVNFFDFNGKANPFVQYCLSSSFYCDDLPGEHVQIYPLNAMFPTGYGTNETGLVTIASAVNNVPEPPIWAITASGFALTGLMARRRQLGKLNARA